MVSLKAVPVVTVEVFVRLLRSGHERAKLNCAKRIEDAVERALALGRANKRKGRGVSIYFPTDQVETDLVDATFPVAVEIRIPLDLPIDSRDVVVQIVLAKLFYYIGHLIGARGVRITVTHAVGMSHLYFSPPQ